MCRVESKLQTQVFESLLCDCDAAVNYANWNYFAGVGTDPRGRVFKTVTQGERYDEAAELARTWLPELAGADVAVRHRPWGADGGNAYVAPIVDVATQIGAGPKGR